MKTKKLVIKCFSNETNNLRILYYTIPMNFVVLSTNGIYTFGIANFEGLQKFISALRNEFKLNEETIANIITKIEEFI